MKLPFASPYGLRESVYWLRKRYTGVGDAHGSFVQTIPRSHVLNENVVPEYTLAFVGDIMPAWKKSVEIGDELKDFLHASDYVIGNLEGVVISSDKTPLFWVPFDLWHNDANLDNLSSIFPPARTYLSVANNHAGDLGETAFFASMEMLSLKDFNTFGSKYKPFCDLNDDIRVISGTMWLNRRNDFVFWLKDAHRYRKQGAFNILFPHFGYEFELYPRPEMMDLAKAWLKDFDAVIGHHSHCPQPITAEPGPHGQQLLAYSLGDFTDYIDTPHYRYGMAAKMSLGRCGQGPWLLGQVEWRFTQCTSLPDKTFRVDICEDLPAHLTRLEPKTDLKNSDRRSV
jgi:hypothetical protein